MEDIIVYGAGGMAKEVVQIIEDLNEVTPQWNIRGYIDDIKGDCGEFINGYKILGTGEILKYEVNSTNVVLAIGNPVAKKMIYDNIKDYRVKFPSLIHPSAKVCKNSQISNGAIIGMDCIVSVNVHIGSHVFLNMRTVVGHDAAIGDFSSCLVNSIIAGDVVIGEASLLGSNCVIMEKKIIGDRAKIGMGSIVDFDVEAEHVVLSRPSKSIYFGP